MSTPHGSDTRRVVLERRKGRFVRRADFYRRATCDLLPSLKLTRPVFGGAGRPARLGIAFRVLEQSRVSVQVLRGNRVVRRFKARGVLPGRTTRLRVPSKGPGRGDSTVRVTVAGRKDRLAASLRSRRL